MSCKVDKRTGIGFVATMCIAVLSLLLCALLMVRGILPESAAGVWLWITFGLASFIGGKLSAAGQGRQACAFLPAAFLYGLIWLLALSCKGEIRFAVHGIGITAAVVVGALLAFLTTCGKRRKKSPHGRKRPVGHALRR
ncbi:MAG: hypothetical protein IKV99_05050 [Oscillospiraceae bacterium]|nr:hypothetical protein [Oscillospiraceae bacterium]